MAPVLAAAAVAVSGTSSIAYYSSLIQFSMCSAGFTLVIDQWGNALVCGLLLAFVCVAALQCPQHPEKLGTQVSSVG